MPDFKPKDIIAGLALLIIMVLKLSDRDGALDTMIALILGYYFAHRETGNDKGI